MVLPGISVDVYDASPARFLTRGRKFHPAQRLTIIDKPRAHRFEGTDKIDEQGRPLNEKLIIFLDGAVLKTEATYRSATKSEANEIDFGVKRKKIVSQIGLRVSKGSDALRPDILHKCLMALQDSEANRVGGIQVFVRVALVERHADVKNDDHNVGQSFELVEVSPNCKIPELYSDFESMMVHLLARKRIVGAVGYKARQTAMRFVKHDLDDIMPINTTIYGLSVTGEAPSSAYRGKKATKKKGEGFDLTRWFDAIRSKSDYRVAIVVGAVAKSDPAPYFPQVQNCYKIADGGLTSVQCCYRLVHHYAKSRRIV